MAFATIIKKMKEDTTCSICLQLMRVPSSINCGHNFCRQCIEGIIENQDVWSQQMYCPLCRRMFDKNSLRPNKQLENLIGTIELMETDMLCEKHGEQLHLFCENDGQVICWACDQSPLHRRHRHVLIKDASLKYKVSECLDSCSSSCSQAELPDLKLFRLTSENIIRNKAFFISFLWKTLSWVPTESDLNCPPDFQ